MQNVYIKSGYVIVKHQGSYGKEKGHSLVQVNRAAAELGRCEEFGQRSGQMK